MEKQMKSNKGITLIALIITIIVMLILVAVTINMAINGGLFSYAGRATGETQNAIDEEKMLAEGKIKIDGVAYNSLDEYLAIEQNGYVARIGDTYYETLQAAFDAVPTDNTQTTVELLKNTTEATTVQQNQNIILEMNGKTITAYGQFAIANEGTMNINGGTITSGDGWAIGNVGTMNINGTVIKENENRYSDCIIYNTSFEELTGKITINDCTITAESYFAICNQENGTIVVTDGTIKSEADYAIYNFEGTVEIRGGTITAENSNAIYNYGGTVEISGDAQIVGKGVGEYAKTIRNENNGTVTITGGTVTAENSNAIYNYGGTVEISGDAQIVGKGVGEYAETIYNEEAGTVTITGGTITSEDSNAIANYGGTVNISGTTTITGSGTESDGTSMYDNDINKSTIYNSYSVNYDRTINISGGTIISENSVAIWNRNIVNISGEAQIIGKAQIGNRNYGMTVLSYNEGTLTISGGTITKEGDGYALVYTYGGLEQTGGTINGEIYVITPE